MLSTTNIYIQIQILQLLDEIQKVVSISVLALLICSSHNWTLNVKLLYVDIYVTSCS